MTWFRCGGSNKPDEYIYNIGPCAFNTGYIPKITTKIIFKAIPTLYAFNSTSSYNTMFGYSPNGDGNKYILQEVIITQHYVVEELRYLEQIHGLFHLTIIYG